MGNKLFRKIISTLTSLATIFVFSGFTFITPVLAAANDSAVMSGDLARATGDTKVYIVDQKGNTWYKRWLVGPQIFDFYGQFGPSAWGRIKEVTPGFISTAVETNLVQVTGHPEVWRLDNCVAGVGCTKRWIQDAATFTGLGYDWNAIRPINDAEGNWHVAGSPVTTTTTTTTSTTTTTTGNFTVTLASDNPAGATLPLGATHVTLMKFTVNGSGTLNSLNVQRFGAGNASDLANVYLYDGMIRLTTGRSINSTTHVVSFTGLNLAISGSKTLSVVGDFTTSSANVGNVDGFRINTSGDVVANATVGGTFPITGQLFSTTAATVGSIQVDKASTLSSPKVGQQNVEVAEFKLTAGSSEDITVNGITLYQTGNISRSNISNFVLTQGGTTIATASGLDASSHLLLTFTTPLVLQKGQVKTFQLFANIGGGSRVNDTITFYLETASDVNAIGNVYGYGVTVNFGPTTGSYDGSSTNYSSETLQGGQVTIAFNGPAVTDYSVQQQNVPLVKFSISSQNNIEIRNFRVRFVAAGTGAGLGTGSITKYTNVKITNDATGVVMTGPKDLTTTGISTTAENVTFTDVWNLNANTAYNFTLSGNIANFTPASDETLKVTLGDGSSGGPFVVANSIKNLDNNLFITTGIVPSGDITGNTFNIKAGALATSLAGTPIAQTYINGAKVIQLAGYNLVAGTGKDVKVTSIKITGAGANSCATASAITNCILTLKLMNGTVQIGDIKSLTSNSDPTATFNNLNLLIAKGTTKTLTLVGDLNTLSTVAGSTTVNFNIAAAADVVAQDVDGNTVSPTGTATGPTMTIASAGTITAVSAPSEIDVTDAHNIIGGRSDVVLSKIRFTASNEALRLNKARITIASTATNAVTGLSLWDSTGNKVADYVTPTSAGVADFNAWLSSFVIPKNGDATLVVKANLNTVGVGQATSGTIITATLDSTSNFDVVGVDTNTDITALSPTTVAGNNMVLRKTLPTVTALALPSGKLTAGTNTLLRFMVTADSAGQLSFKKLGFTINMTDITTSTDLDVSSPQIQQVINGAASGTNIPTTNSMTANTASTSETRTLRMLFNSEEQVAVGTSKTYDLLATVSNVGGGTDNDSIQTALAQQSGVDDTATVTPGAPGNDTAANLFYIRTGSGSPSTLATLDPAIATADGLDSYFIWSDYSAVPHSDTLAGASATTTTGSLDWIHGYKIRTIPTSAKTICQSNCTGQ